MESEKIERRPLSKEDIRKLSAIEGVLFSNALTDVDSNKELGVCIQLGCSENYLYLGSINPTNRFVESQRMDYQAIKNNTEIKEKVDQIKEIYSRI